MNVRRLPIFHVPFGLIPEQQVNEREILILRQTAGDLLGRAIVGAQREDAEDVKDLAGVDIVGLELRERCSALKAAQTGQLGAAYSISTTLAFLLPMVRSVGRIS